MRKIIRRILNTDLGGNILTAKFEQLDDNEAGTIEETNLTAVSRCEGCGRPLEKLNEINGTCIRCGRSCCSICSGFCSICGRGPFCGRCKTGFPEGRLSVCSNCLSTLKERLTYEDRLAEEKVAFERIITVYTTWLKLIQLLQHNEGKLSRLLTRIAQIGTAHKIVRLERKLKREINRGRRLLP